MTAGVSIRKQIAEIGGYPVYRDHNVDLQVSDIYVGTERILASVPDYVDDVLIEREFRRHIAQAGMQAAHGTMVKPGYGYGAPMDSSLQNSLYIPPAFNPTSPSSRPDMTGKPAGVAALPPEEQFDENELTYGQALELRRVKTPQVGKQFDAIRMTVDTVLVLNKLVEQVEILQQRVQELEDQLIIQKAAPPEPEEPIKLTSLADSYKDVSE